MLCILYSKDRLCMVFIKILTQNPVISGHLCPILSRRSCRLCRKDNLNRIKVRFHMIVLVICRGGNVPYHRDNYMETRL